VRAITVSFPDGRETLQGEHSAIRETHSPTAVPASFWVLRCFNVLNSALQEEFQVVPATVGPVSPKEGQGRYNGRGTLRVIVLVHDSTEYLSTVQILEVWSRSGPFVRRTSPGRVLIL
jgi:hypothetical protein